MPHIAWLRSLQALCQQKEQQLEDLQEQLAAVQQLEAQHRATLEQLKVKQAQQVGDVDIVMCL
jgi:hypothetical protein